MFVEVFLKDAWLNFFGLCILSGIYITIVNPIYRRYRWSFRSPESPDTDSRSCVLKSPTFNLLMDTGTSSPLELSETEQQCSVCFSPQPWRCDWCGSRPGMVFPGLGRGQGWSAATFPLSSWATAPSLYLRSPNNIHAALVPLGQAHPSHHTGRGGLAAR